MDKVVVAYRTVYFDGLLVGADSGVAPCAGSWLWCCFLLSHGCDDLQGSGPVGSAWWGEREGARHLVPSLCMGRSCIDARSGL